MIPFHSVLPEVAEREARCVHFRPAPGTPPGSCLPAGEYTFVEFHCEDLGCDCRRVFLEVIAPHRPDTVLASINYGWESESFYRERMPWDADAPREVVAGSLDPINATVRLSNGMALSWKAARMMGYLPPQARPEDLF